MVCALVVTLNSVIQSIRDLQVRVETLIPEITLPENLTTLCGDGGGQGLLPDLYFSVLSFVLEAGEDVTETVARTAEPTCYTGSYLSDMEAWIDGIQIDAVVACSLSWVQTITTEAVKMAKRYAFPTPNPSLNTLRLVVYTSTPPPTTVRFYASVYAGGYSGIRRYNNENIVAADFDANGYFEVLISVPHGSLSETDPMILDVGFEITGAGAESGQLDAALVCEGALTPVLPGSTGTLNWAN